MKRILVGLSALTLIATSVASGTGAFFSDSAASTGNTFSSGSMDLQLSNDNTTYSASTTATFGGTNLFPGQNLPADVMYVKNNGAINGHHLNLIVDFPAPLTADEQDLAKSIIFTGTNGLRFGNFPPLPQIGTDSENLLIPDGFDYTIAHANGTAYAGANALDFDASGDVSLWDLYKLTAGAVSPDKIRITPQAGQNGAAAGTSAALYIDPEVKNTLTAQGASISPTFTWEIQQDISQQ